VAQHTIRKHRVQSPVVGSACGAAGERCLAGSVLVPVGDAAGPLLELLAKRTEALAVGDGSKAAWKWGR